MRRLSPSPAGQLTAEWNKALRGEGIKQDSTRWVTILGVLLPTKAAFWQKVGRRRCELVNTKPYMQVRPGPLKNGVCRRLFQLELDRGDRTWPLRLHSSFLAGTRVRAMIIGTRARLPIRAAHSGR